MISLIVLEIIFNWFLMGSLMAIVLTSGLYFAILCEKFADLFYSR